MGEPFAPRHYGCGGRAIKGHCGGRVTWVGVKFYPQPPRLFRAFACDEHVWQLDVARPLDDEGAAQLAARRERHRLVVDEHQPYAPEPPLGEGQDAVRMLAEARAWAAGRPECRTG